MPLKQTSLRGKMFKIKINGDPHRGILGNIPKEIAIQNIKSHPLKFLQNCFSNNWKNFFNYPWSYDRLKNQRLYVGCQLMGYPYVFW